jgi:hypothetical protein
MRLSVAFCAADARAGVADRAGWNAWPVDSGSGTMAAMAEMASVAGKQLGRLEPVDPRTIWPHEALNFTPWLAQNADRLAEALGIEMELEGTEHAVGGYSLDVIGKDQTNGVVLIVENQLGDSDHGHLGQLLTYAAGTAASTIVWITTRFRDEHRQALTWLNEHTDQDTHFFGVELEVVRIGSSDPAPLFKVVALPNDWQKSVRASTVAAAKGTRSELYREFWAKFLNRLRAEHPAWTKASPAAQNWLWLAAPIKGCGINPVFGAQGRIRQELYIDRPTPEQCQGVFDALHIRREEFEAAYGRPLQWDLLGGRKACRISESTSGAVENEAEHEKYIDFFIDAGQRFRTAINAVDGVLL